METVDLAGTAGDVALTEVEQAQIRKSFYSMVARLFNEIPDAAFVRKVCSPAFAEPLRAFVAEADNGCGDDIAAGCALMLGFVDAHANESAESLSHVLGVDRTRIYRGVSPDYGPKPPYEAEWRTGHASAAGSLLQDIAREYGSCGLEVAQSAHNRADYLGVELDFLGVLVGREIEAVQAGDAQAIREAAARERSFVEEHLLTWVPWFIDAALAEVRTDFYRGHLTLLRGLLECDTDWLAQKVA